MRLYERIASALIGTPLQHPAERLRSLWRIPRQLKHPEMREIYLEDERIGMIMKNAITDGVNCIDVGCHLGSVLQEFVNLSPSGRHTAFEPLPYKAAWLRQKYPGVEVHQVALGDQDGQVNFFFNPRMSGYSGLRAHHATEGESEKLVVECRKLDDLVPAGRPVGYLKIDVEGGEYFVLRGARRILAESRPLILFECTRSGLTSFGLALDQMFSLLNDDLAYRIFLPKDWLRREGPLTLAGFEAATTYPFQAFNFIAARASDSLHMSTVAGA